ncbi:MAG: serine/threonine-protein phosphatase [Clostridia bacterium]|nr:serine/threonine-protein phosphatase [Clostridia bacterium]
MKPIVGEAIVSCYAIAAAFLELVVLLLLSERLRRRNSAVMRLFHMLSVCVAWHCLLAFLNNAMYMQTAPWCHTAAIVLRTLRECLVLPVISLWLIYVDHMLYGQRRRYPRALKLVFASFGVFFALIIVNLFTGILFTYSAENRLESKLLLNIIHVAEFIDFCSAAVTVRYFDRRATKVRFIRVSPMILSIILASGTQFFAPYDIGVLGQVTGLTLLYFSMIGELRFVDEGSQMYNRRYLAYLFDMALAGKNDTHSALILEADGDLPACFGILRDILHRDSDVIRMEEKKFLVFSGETSLSTLQYLISLVDEAVERQNAAHPEARVRITARCRMRAADEDAFTFVRTVMDDKEAGGEMRGIASMISELDRLDQELALASDIQTHILPMVFPPFPDRHEFDIYASMNAAKEVGGDFYDFFLVDPDHLALVIADVSGKGIPAALFMMVSKTLIKNQLMAGLSPAEAFANVNAQLCERNESKMFVTVWAAVVEISTGRGLACNAGHESPGIRQTDGRFELIAYRHNMFMGVSKKARFTDRPFEMAPGQSLFVYTDGVPEAKNGAGEMMGSERLEAALNTDPDAEPEALIGHVRSAVEAFVKGAEQFDDITMLAFKYRGNPAEKESVRPGPPSSASPEGTGAAI